MWYLLAAFGFPLIVSVAAQGLPCTQNSDCSPFDRCVFGICVANNNGCPNNTCPGHQGCIGGQCRDVARRCTADSHCSVFQFCSSNRCILDHRACGRCEQTEVCINRQCVPNPLLPRAPRIVTTPAPRTCRSGWFHLPQHNACYLVQHGSFNYHQANFNCQSLGVHLVSIGSLNEMIHVNALTGGVPFWIGARKHNGIWFWQDGRIPFSYTNWRPGPPRQPDNCCGRDVSCVLVNFADGRGLWDDAGCDERHRPNQGYVCKEFL